MTSTSALKSSSIWATKRFLTLKLSEIHIELADFTVTVSESPIGSGMNRHPFKALSSSTCVCPAAPSVSIDNATPALYGEATTFSPGFAEELTALKKESAKSVREPSEGCG